MAEMATKGTAYNLEGYVIRASPYKDNDEIITYLSKDGQTVFSAKGIKKPTSKNRSAMTILAKSKVTLLKTGDTNLLLESSLISYPRQGDDYLRAACLMFISELNSKILSEENTNLYEWLDSLMSNFNDDQSSPLTLVSIYFAQLLRFEGYGLDVDKCVICGKKNDIVGISMSDGGFVCRDDLEYESQKKEPLFLKMLRFCFRCSPKDMGRVKFENNDALSVIYFLASFYEENTGEKLKSIGYLRKI